MNMRQRNSAKPKLQVYVSQEVADRLRDYASLVGVSASFATEMALRTYLNMEKSEIMTKRITVSAPAPPPANREREPTLRMVRSIVY
jgi:post-segregation antitoxin (ccd killing protein)